MDRNKRNNQSKLLMSLWEINVAVDPQQFSRLAMFICYSERHTLPRFLIRRLNFAKHILYSIG